MIQANWKRTGLQRMALFVLAGVGILTMPACELPPLLDPSQPDGGNATPVILPILSTLDIIDEPSDRPPGVTPVQREDLIPEVREYVIGTGDVVIITVHELRNIGVDENMVRDVDELGVVRLPFRIGTVKAGGRTASQLEQDLINILEKKDILKDPEVNVVVQTKTHDTWQIIGEPGQDSTRFGVYPVPRPDFRLLEAIAMAQGISERTRTLLVYRTVALAPEVAGEVPSEPVEGDNGKVPDEAGKDPSDLIGDLDRALDPSAPPGTGAPEEPAGDRPPAALDRGLGEGGTAPKWVWVDGKWVKVQGTMPSETRGVDDFDTSDLITQRIIEVPYNQLVNGDMRYNIVIRPGDTIKVPSRERGNVYINGQITRPGTYLLPGENDLTVKSLVASAGDFTGTAIPRKAELIRRIGVDQEAFVRIDVARMFKGEVPDIYLKPNDQIIIHSNLIAVPLAVGRNGFRMTYGFGFILDRNFNLDVFRPDNIN